MGFWICLNIATYQFAGEIKKDTPPKTLKNIFNSNIQNGDIIF